MRVQALATYQTLKQQLVCVSCQATLIPLLSAPGALSSAVLLLLHTRHLPRGPATACSHSLDPLLADVIPSTYYFLNWRDSTPVSAVLLNQHDLLPEDAELDAVRQQGLREQGFANGGGFCRAAGF